jgi:hypothetical protein
LTSGPGKQLNRWEPEKTEKNRRTGGFENRRVDCIFPISLKRRRFSVTKIKILKEENRNRNERETKTEIS